MPHELPPHTPNAKPEKTARELLFERIAEARAAAEAREPVSSVSASEPPPPRPSGTPETATPPRPLASRSRTVPRERRRTVRPIPSTERSSAPSAPTIHGKGPQPSRATPPDFKPDALSRNPRVLRYWRKRLDFVHVAVRQANEWAIRRRLEALELPTQAFDILKDICSDERACAGALEWVRRAFGPAVALEVEAAALYRTATVQHDDWSCARARRKLALLVLMLLTPLELPRSAVTGSTSEERVLTTCGVPQTLLVKMLRSGQRAPYNVRTLQRDLAEIEECTHLLLRWRTPLCKAEAFERRGQSEGVVNRYVMRCAMVRERWRRASCVGEALAKRLALSFARLMVWEPRARGPIQTTAGPP